ncbi:hypothetical protein M430DRAFT_66307 [Amorphotheca resinae ATCC 22711]|uniref:Calpain catalytic domain-containing protein n=1 Tax=Amorphotheca resinae ATCC 22711 TaxID=857342 RepID=A0A2T3B4R7_AMORE|nr:hypothetical protein M430DRAFT_66307 [Amorphotheca resinae ATCC 22711]PSS20630.1 hypothetical protein M430DRAFT_66307 [Amorphotheca resinae ATCC 22711]
MKIPLLPQCDDTLREDAESGRTGLAGTLHGPPLLREIWGPSANSSRQLTLKCLFLLGKVASYAEAAAICKVEVEKIVKESRRVNQKYRDPYLDIEFDLKCGTKDCLTMLPGSVKRVGDIFDEPEFYKSGATANDIRQGKDGDCWLKAALCTLGNKPGLIEDVCVARDEEVGVYGILYLTKPDYDESWIERNLIEDRKRINSEEDYRRIYQTGSGSLYFAQCEDPNETWLPLLEKAYAKAHGDYAAIEGGFTGEGLEDLTGAVTTGISSTDILDKEYFWREELSKVTKEFLFGCGMGLFWGRGERKGIVEGHAYSIMRAVEMDGKRLCLLRNPWGAYEWNGSWSDGSKEWTPDWMQKLEHRFGDNSTFWMSYEDLLKKYQTFDHYHSTKFYFTLEKKAPVEAVVLVLSQVSSPDLYTIQNSYTIQLDSRYFCGLEGQYSFQLSFRVHKAGEEDYIVQSHGNYSMRRSVTVELELEPGEYHVLMRVEAEKNDHAFPVEQALRNNVKARRNKLLRIGLAYDLAYAKGQIKETDEERKVRKELEAKKKSQERKEMKDKLMKEKKRRKHVETRRLAKAREEKKIAEEKEEKEENEKQKKEPEKVKEKG